MLRQRVPPVGTVARFARAVYDPSDKDTRRGVVVAIEGPNAVVVMRSTTSHRRGDVEHAIDQSCGCTLPGRWQPTRWYRIPLVVFDKGGPDVKEYPQPLDAATLAKVIAAWRAEVKR
jgi:hypothetical protein